MRKLLGIAMVAVLATVAILFVAKKYASEYVTHKVVIIMSREMVDNYRPVGQYKWEEEPHDAAVLNLHCANYQARVAVYRDYEKRNNMNDYEIYDDGVNELVLMAVRKELSDPEKLWDLYITNVDIVLAEMRRFASQEGKLNDKEINEMFSLYRDEAMKFSKYLAFALVNKKELVDLNAVVIENDNTVTASYASCSEMSHRFRQKYMEIIVAYGEKQDELIRKVGQSYFNDERELREAWKRHKEKRDIRKKRAGLLVSSIAKRVEIPSSEYYNPEYSIQWVERRRAEGGDDLLKMYKIIADDFASRLEKEIS